ncbi:cyanophycinase [Caulobacter sp. ErkDOM-YI]|uniref:cyanophycinase n=1 Tax=unclassified Caulobacter TaxID=2648921 RepID=UPI003AF7A0C9
MRGLLILLLGGLIAGPAAAQGGTLVIVGGALSRDNDAVHAAFIDAARAHAPPGVAPRFLIIPAASGAPSDSAQSFAQQLQRRGVGADQIAVARVAVRDDPGTADIDESLWASGGSAPEEVAKAAPADGVWFVGGDQARIVATLKTAKGEDTPLLIALRARLAQGAVIGGTSAGAAIMSEAMILQGDSLPALLRPLGATETADGEALAMGRGLGFFTGGLVDQHFDRRARLGRLARAVATLPLSQRIGFGIDENTALVIDLATRSARAIGAGGVTILDERSALIDVRDSALHLRQAHLHFISGGDRVDLATLAVTPAGYKQRLKPSASATARLRVAEGLAAPAQRLDAWLAEDLVGVAASTRIERPSFLPGGAGIRFGFARTPSSAAYQGRDAQGRDRDTIVDVAFDVSPVHVVFRP